MAELRDLDATDESNTTIGGIGAEGSSNVSNFDNIIRAMAGMLKRMVTGAAPLDDTVTFRDPDDGTKLFRFDGGSITAGNTRVLTVPNATGTLQTENVKAANGTEALPSVSFSSDTDTGMSRGGDNTLRFSTNGTTRLKIASTGSVLIGDESYTGTDAGDVGINLQGAGSSGPGAISATASGTASLFLNRLASNGNVAQFYRSGSLVGSIQVTTTTTTYNTSSDARLKENFSDFDSGALIDRMQMYRFDWKAGGEGYGPKAQELNEIFPHAVSYDYPTDAWGWDASKLVPVLVREVQSLRARLAAAGL